MCQRDINYDDFIGEEVLITWASGCGLASLMTLVEIVAPDYVNGSELCYKFDNGEKTICLVKGDIYQFIPTKWLADEEHEYFYVVFRYGKTARSKEHIYMSNDYSIKPGDRVLPCCDERAVNVVRTGFFNKANAPYPVEKTWLVTRKAYMPLSPIDYHDFDRYIENENKYYNRIKTQKEDTHYISKATETYNFFNYYYIESVCKRLIPDKNGNLNGKGILSFLNEEFCGGDPYLEGKGDFLNRKNQIYTFFDSVWLSFLLAQNHYVEDEIIDAYKYMLCIYNHGGFDKYLLDVEYDKKCLNEHIAFINNYINFAI